MTGMFKVCPLARLGPVLAAGFCRKSAGRSFQAWLVAAFLLAAASQPASAFSVRRGINLDIWTTWPSEQQWGDRNVLLPYPEWRRVLKPADLQALKAAGFDFVRMPVDPAPFLSDRSAPLADELFASVLDSARMVNAAGLKAVVDLHLVPAGERSVGTQEVLNDPALFERYTEIVRRMADTLAGEDPSRIALELMNEPTRGCAGEDAKDWTQKLKRLFAAARGSASRLTLVLAGACWGSAEGLAALDPKAFQDDNLIWGFHAYGPFLLTHQGATWSGDFIRYVTGIPFPPHTMPRAQLDAAIARVKETIGANAPLPRRAGMKAYLDELLAEIDTREELSAVMEKPFATVDAWASKNGIAPTDILLGEFGMVRQEYGNPYVVPADQRAAYYRDMIGRAERRGYGWSLWSYGGAFGVVEAFDTRRAEPDVLDMVRGLPDRPPEGE